jgi:hypothetical protein
MPAQEDQSLEESLVRSIAKPNLTELADLAEVGLDQLLQEGVLRDIPVLGTLVGLYRTMGIVRDRIFATKVIRFLVGLSNTPIKDREQFLEEHDEPAKRRELGETLVLVLDRLDDMQKPEALARLFAAYLQGRFDLVMFRRLATALDRVPLSSISDLNAFYRVELGGFPPKSEYLPQFAFAGLMDIEFVRTGPTGGPGGSYIRNGVGRLFLEILGDA